MFLGLFLRSRCYRCVTELQLRETSKTKVSNHIKDRTRHKRKLIFLNCLLLFRYVSIKVSPIRFPVSHAPPKSERQRHREALITLKLLHRHAVTPWNPSLENCPNDRRELPVRRPAAGSVFKHLTSCAGSSSVIIPAL